MIILDDLQVVSARSRQVGGGSFVTVARKFYLGDVVQMRKAHPCGDDRWEVLRTGMDFRMKCLGCGRVVMLPRRKFEKQVRAIISRTFDEHADGTKSEESGSAER